MIPRPEWCGAQRIASYYGLTPNEVTTAANANGVTSIDLLNLDPDSRAGGVCLYYTPGFDFIIRRAVERRQRRIAEAMEKHLAEVIKNGGRLP